MRRIRLIASSLACLTLLAIGCRPFARRPPPEPSPGADTSPPGPGPGQLLPYGRDDGMDVPASIRGKVVKVDKLVGVAVINVGELQGVRPRYAFLVVREGRLIGKLVVEETFDDMAACRYGKTMKGHVEVGDEVTTRLDTE